MVHVKYWPWYLVHSWLSITVYKIGFLSLNQCFSTLAISWNHLCSFYNSFCKGGAADHWTSCSGSQGTVVLKPLWYYVQPRFSLHELDAGWVTSHIQSWACLHGLYESTPQEDGKNWSPQGSVGGTPLSLGTVGRAVPRAWQVKCPRSSPSPAAFLSEWHRFKIEFCCSLQKNYIPSRQLMERW